MQIIRTETTEAIAAEGHPLVRVKFCGEGGECVTVDMAASEGVNVASPLDRARAILVQTASFSDAANAYDAVSSGIFDEVAATSAHGHRGSVFVFEYRDGEGSRQTPPATMPSVDAARSEALRSAVDLLMDLQPGGTPLSGWLVRVRNESGELLFGIDVQEAQAARPEAL